MRGDLIILISVTQNHQSNLAKVVEVVFRPKLAKILKVGVTLRLLTFKDKGESLASSFQALHVLQCSGIITKGVDKNYLSFSYGQKSFENVIDFLKLK
jgi:hypothetical protein